MPRWPKLASVVAVVVLLAARALAQEPKAGGWYENPNLSFKFKAPAKWDPIPPSPDDLNLVIKYDPPTTKYIQAGPSGRLWLHCWVLKFDRSKSADEEKGTVKYATKKKNLKAWIEDATNVGPAFKEIGKPRDVEINKIPAQIVEWETDSDPNCPKEWVQLYTITYKLSPDLDVTVAFNGPGKDKWPKFGRGCEEIAKTFTRFEAKVDPKAAAAAASGTQTLRDQKRAELEKKLREMPSWKLYSTEHYFVVSDNDDKAFLDELMARLEAIHALYEIDYPPERAKALRAAGKANSTGSGQQAGPKRPEAEEEQDDKVDPQERAKCSVVRVCKDREEYMSYGGPGGSAGYWSPNAQELVLYDDRKVGGKGSTWAVLNHEGFHQYIFYFFGSLSPHSWYNEGTGDFYSGYQYKNKQFKLEKFQWRTGIIKTALQQDTYVPLKEFLRYTQQQYYDETPVGEVQKVSICYAQGWSFIYFLRTGKKANAKGWDPKWDNILDAYLTELAMTGQVDKAVDKAFDGIDLDALEAAWKAYTN